MPTLEEIAKQARESSEPLELAVFDAKNAVQIFTQGGLDAVLDGIETKVRAIPLDPSTAAGREEIRSVAYKVVRTKTTLDAEGKKLTEGWREATAKVNAERKRSLERLDALAEEIRKPLTDFENKEAARVAEHESALTELSGLLVMLRANPDMSATLLGEHLEDYTVTHPIHAERKWEEFSTRASAIRTETVDYLKARFEARLKYEAEQAELTRLRQEEADRIQRERDERIKAEAAEKARLEAERKAKEAADSEAKRVIEAAQAEQKRVAVEAERVRLENERIQREAEDARRREENEKIAALKRAADAESARIFSEKKAEEDKRAAVAKAAEDLRIVQEKAKRDAEAYAQRERDQIAKEQKEAEDARIKREANAKLRAKIRAEIVQDIAEHSANEIADLLMDGKVRNVKVVF